MKRLTELLFVIVLLSFPTPSVLAAEILTNDTIVTMVKAGLGEDLIMSKIRISQHQFDLSTSSILQLKSQGVSEKIIQAMMEASAKQGPPDQSVPQAGTSSPTAPVPTLPPGMILGTSSLYVRLGDRSVEMPPVVAEVQHSLKKHFIPFYFGPGDMWHYVRGPKSVVRLTSRKPVFHTRVNPSGFLLTKLSYEPNKDIRYVVSTGGTYRNTVPFSIGKKPDESFELSPKGELEPGEYAFVHLGTFFDFGVE